MQLRTPRISGTALASLAKLARSRVGRGALRGILRRELKVGMLAELPDALRGDVPLDTRPLQARPPRAVDDAKLAVPGGSWAGSSDTFARAFKDGRTTPREVVDRALSAARDLASRKPSVGPIFDFAEAEAVAEADEATARWKSGHPRGPLDGVPYAAKEEAAVRGLPRRSGTAYAESKPQPEDATFIARLRAQGAIVIGTTPMTEQGMTPLGCNAMRTMPKNPHAPEYVAGGSSTGSGVAVATGLVPFAIGCDGGGSIRIPSAMNGVFGIKPTWGRVSRYGDTAAGSVSHVGPLASSTLDLARVLDVIGPPDPLDSQTDHSPKMDPGGLERALSRGVKGLRIGVEDREWRDASPSIARACEEALRALEREGATVVKVQLPLARFAPAIGYVVIGTEARVGLREDWRDHASEMSHDLQVAFTALETLSSIDYVDALRLRAGLRRELRDMFADVDLLALPTTASTAVRASESEMLTGFVDPKALDDFCRFAFLGNLTGLPAGSAPVAKDEHGLPIGLQLVGDAWDEATVLAAMAHLERIGAATAERPRESVEVIPR